MAYRVRFPAPIGREIGRSQRLNVLARCRATSWHPSDSDQSGAARESYAADGETPGQNCSGVNRRSDRRSHTLLVAFGRQVFLQGECDDVIQRLAKVAADLEEAKWGVIDSVLPLAGAVP